MLCSLEISYVCLLDDKTVANEEIPVAKARDHIHPLTVAKHLWPKSEADDAFIGKAS